MKADLATAHKLNEKPSYLVSVSEKMYDQFRKKNYVIAKEECLATVECVGCGYKSEIWNMVRKYDGDVLRWFFCRKKGNDMQTGEPSEKQSL
jgi:Zn ribbon nucleic-acid-binding protein